MKEKLNITFRQATIADAKELVILEMEVWGVDGANYDQLVSRIKTFPRGNVVAVYNQHIVGYVSFEYVDNVVNEPDFTWADITDNGLIAKSHQRNGKYIYAINLSAHHSMNGSGLSFALILRVWMDAILYNKKGAFLGSRMPGFRDYKEKNPTISAEEYVRLRRNGWSQDPELRLYERDGLTIMRVLPNYFPCKKSMDYGVLIYRNNPFYNWPLKMFWVYIIKKIPTTRKNFRNKGGVK